MTPSAAARSILSNAAVPKTSSANGNVARLIVVIGFQHIRGGVSWWIELATYKITRVRKDYENGQSPNFLATKYLP